MPQSIPVWVKWAMVIASTAYSVGSSATMRRKAKQAAEDAAGISTMLKESTVPWTYVYGERRVSGPIVFAHETGQDRKYLQLVIVLAPHEVFELKWLWFDDEIVTVDWGGTTNTGVAWTEGAPPPNPSLPVDQYKTQWSVEPGTAISSNYKNKAWVERRHGRPGQTVFERLNRELPTLWTTAHTLTGCAAVHVKLEWDQGVYHGGIPNISFTMRGKILKDFVYTDGLEYHWSANPANVAYDLLTDTKIGAGLPDSSIDHTALREAAIHSHESVTVQTSPAPTDGSHYRYSCNLVVDSAVNLADNLEHIANSMAGSIVRSNGIWFIRSGKYRVPSITLTEKDIIGPITVMPRASKGTLCNAVRGTFISEPPNYLHTVTDFPPYESDVYLAQDNGEKLWADLDMPFCRCPVQAQRLAKIHLERNRQQITVSLMLGLQGLKLMPTDTVALTLARYGWVSKVFEVVSWKLDFSTGDDKAPMAVVVNLQETASTVYDWVAASDETPYDPAPDTLLPNPFDIPDPVSPTVERVGQVNSDGVWRVQAKVSWTAPVNGYASQVITRYKISTDADWVEVSPVPATQESTMLLALIAGLTYNVEVCNMNSFGARSDFVACTPDPFELVVDEDAPEVEASSAAFSLGTVLLGTPPVPILKDVNGVVYPRGSWLTYNTTSYPVPEDFSHWEVCVRINIGAATGADTPPDGNQTTFITDGIERAACYATKAQYDELTGTAKPIYVWARAFDFSGNATDWFIARSGTSGTMANKFPAITGDMVNQNSSAVSTSGIQTGASGASSVQKVLCRFPHYLVHTCTGGSTVETVTISLTNRGFSTAPDTAAITFTSAHDNVVAYYDRAASSSTSAVLKLVREDGVVFGAGWVYGINVEFVEYD